MTNTEEWKRHVAEWRGSGLTAEEFCKEKSFTRARLWTWSSRLRKAERAATGGVQLARVTRQASAERNEGAVAVEFHGARIVVGAGVDRATLATVLELVDGLRRPTGGAGR